MMMKGLARAAVAALGLLATGTSTLAQTPRIANLKARAGNFPAVQAEFDILDATGEPLATLRQDQVGILEDGKRAAVSLEPASAKQGIAWLLIVDTSGSMRHALPRATEALAAFVGRLGELDRVALAPFSADVGAPAEFTADRARIIAELRRLRASGTDTELFFAVNRALGAMERPGLPERRIAVVVSDGRDEGKAYTLDDGIAKANALVINVVGIATPASDPRSALAVRRLAEMTGGAYLGLQDGEDWAGRLEMIDRYARSRWVVSWSTTFPGDGREREATIEITLGDVRVTRSASFEVARIPEPPPPPVWRRWLPWVAAGAAVVLITAAATWLMVRRRRALAGAAREERDRQSTEERERIGREFEEVKRRIDQAAQAAPTPPAGTVRPKGKTTFWTPDSASPAPVALGAASLVVLQGQTQGATISLTRDATLLGREEDNHVVLDEERVSRYHAAVQWRDGRYWIADRGSANGTWINGDERVEHARPLRDGDRIRIGGVELEFRAGA